jgi:5-methylcytosine-specific restriction endonuclease McrA
MDDDPPVPRARKPRGRPPLDISPEERRARILAKKARYRARHRDKIKAAAAKYRAENRDKIRALQAQWTADNPDKRREQRQRYSANNKDKRRATDARYRANNKTKVQAKRANQHARKRGAVGSHSAAETAALLARQKSRCAHPWCRTDISKGRGDAPGYFHEDHILPIKLGGSNDITNVQLLCQACNIAKGQTHPVEWAQSHGMLL